MGHGNEQGHGIRRARDLTLFFQSKSDEAAAILSIGTNFAGLVGRNLLIKVDEASVFQEVKFVNDDFVNPASPTAAEVVTKINSATTGITAAAEADGRVSITSDTVGGASRLRIGKGTANALFGWPEGWDVDASTNGAVLTTYDESDLFPPITVRHGYAVSTKVFTRIVPTTGEVMDFDAETLTMPHGVSATWHCWRILF